MKVLVISNMYPSAADPAYGTFVRNFYEDLCERNGERDTRLVTIRGRRMSKWSKLSSYVSFYSGALWALLSRRYDLIYVHTVTFPTPALRIAAALRRLPIVFNVHGDDVLPQTRLKKRLKEMVRPLLGGIRMMVVPSKYFQRVVIKEFPELNPAKIYVSASGGVAKKFFADGPREAFPSVPTLGFVSRIDPGKGWREFVELIAMLRGRGVECRGVMVGRGAQDDELRQLIAAKGLSQVIDYQGGLSQEALIAVYREMDLFVFPTVRPQESLGLVALEAMAAGVPVVASNMAGPTSYVIDGVNGYLVTPGSVEAMAEAVKRYIALDDKAKQQMSAEAIAEAGAYEAVAVSEALFKKISELGA